MPFRWRPRTARPGHGRFDIVTRYAPRASEVLGGPPLGWDGQVVRLRSPGTIPARCIGCGTPAGLFPQQTRLRHLNPWLNLSVLLTPFALLLVAVLASRRIVVAYSRCGDCRFTSRCWTWVSRVAGGLFVAAFAALLVLASRQDVRGDFATIFLAMTASGVVYVISGQLARPRMRALGWRDDVFVTGGLKKAYTRRL